MAINKKEAEGLGAEAVQALAEGLAIEARRWKYTADELERGALELRETAEGWRLVFQRAHYGRGEGRAVARYKIPPELARRSDTGRAVALAIWAALKLSGTARAIRANASRSQAAKANAARVAILARHGRAVAKARSGANFSENPGQAERAENSTFYN